MHTDALQMIVKHVMLNGIRTWCSSLHCRCSHITDVRILLNLNGFSEFDVQLSIISIYASLD